MPWHVIFVFNKFCKFNSLAPMYFSSISSLSQLINKNLPIFCHILYAYFLSNNSDSISYLLDMFPTVILLFLSFVLAFQGYCNFLLVGPSVLSCKVLILHYCCCSVNPIKCNPPHAAIWLKASTYSLLLRERFFKLRSSESLCDFQVFFRGKRTE